MALVSRHAIAQFLLFHVLICIELLSLLEAQNLKFHFFKKDREGNAETSHLFCIIGRKKTNSMTKRIGNTDISAFSPRLPGNQHAHYESRQPGTKKWHNHRTVGVGRDLQRSSSPTPLLRQGHLEHATQDCISKESSLIILHILCF